MTFMATLLSASLKSLSLITLLCTLFPSRPAKGLSFIPKVTLIVGGSMGSASIGSSTANAHNVSETVDLFIPAKETMSPAVASSMSFIDRPLKANIFVILNCSIFWPMRLSA